MPMTAPWLDDGDVRLYHGDAAVVLAALPAASVQTCVTSPPYWGLRDYGTGEWTGGSAECDHAYGPPHRDNRGGLGNTPRGFSGAYTRGEQGHAAAGATPYRDVCGRCGARRADSQLGLEPTPDLYVERLVAVFREVRRVLRDDGTLWLNLGDSFFGGGYANHRVNGEEWLEAHGGDRRRTRQQDRINANPGLKPKDLVGIPWRVAFALQADGWYLRSDIIWSKPNPMPESVTDRPTKSHEYLFLLSKRPKYYWDADAIREPHESSLGGRTPREDSGGGHSSPQLNGRGGVYHAAGRNARSVWQIATQPTPEAHFATFPEELARRCILAGSSEAGECSACGAPWQRIVERTPSTEQRHNWNGHAASKGGASRKGGFYDATSVTTGWAPACACGTPAQPQLVLDPFAGSGTSLLVARHHARHAIGIDLSSEYLAIAAGRLRQLSLLA